MIGEHLEKPAPMIALSLILCSRNDSYMGNSLWRLRTALEYLADVAHELKRDDQVEVLVSDWASDVPLHQALKLSPAAERIVSFLVVPPSLALTLNTDSPFPEVLALNAAVRHARGEYVGRIDQDTLVGKTFIETFFDIYEGRRSLPVPFEKALMFANRRRIPYRFAARCPSMPCLKVFLGIFKRLLRVEIDNPYMPFYITFVGIWLLHRDIWHTCGAFDESMIYMNGMEFDMATRLMTRYDSVIDLGKLVSYDFYHLEHYNPLAPRKALTHRKVNQTRWQHLDASKYKATVFHVNNSDWGLRKHPLELVLSHRSVSPVQESDWREQVSALMGILVLMPLVATQMLVDLARLTPRRVKKRVHFLSAGCRHWISLALIIVSNRKMKDWPALFWGRWSSRTAATLSWLDRHPRVRDIMRGRQGS
jgi:hypothetical protein